MKVKNGFNLREVCGEHIIVAEGDEVQKMDSFTVDNLVELICNQYEIDEDTARKDATMLAAQWGTAGIIEGEDIPADASALKKETVSEEAESTHLEAATSEEKPKKKGFFERLFG